MKRLIFRLTLFLVLTVSFLIFLLTTTQGFYTSIYLANRFIPGKIQFRHLSGRWVDHLNFEELSYDNNKLQVKLTQGHFEWALVTLLKREFTLTHGSARQLQVRLKDPTHVQRISLPLPFQLNVDSLELKGSLKQGTILETHIDWQDAQWHPSSTTIIHSQKGHITVNGTLPQILIQGSTEIKSPIEAQLHMKLTANSLLAKPIVKGDISLSLPKLTLPTPGLILGPLIAKLHTEKNHWQVLGSLMTNQHPLAFKGQGEFAPTLTGQLDLAGGDFPFVPSNEYSFLLSPQLTLRFKPNAFDITGTILVPKALLKPISFSNTVTLSEDAVFISKDKSIANPFNITLNVQLIAGAHVRLVTKGLKAFLDGTIHMTQAPNTQMSTSGELTLRHGTYRAYGQKLIVEQGQLVYNDDAIDNPSFHIRAIRRINNTHKNGSASEKVLDFSAKNIDPLDVGAQTTVGIELTGHLNAHKITLFSIPRSLSQADILSLLLLGVPANLASQSGGQLLISAISSMNLGSGAKGLQLLTQLKQTLGVDLNIKNNNAPNQGSLQTGNNTSVVVGKSLSKNIYLSYNMGILQNDSNVLTLKYLLNKYFSIQVTSSDTGNGLDLLYTH
ncbi:MAG: translocation/assembly module TamB domain-containing protein [Legionellales bacterium]|nr:translocation/assembly module TamB domain-containing protein [Legionellales bacterium]